MKSLPCGRSKPLPYEKPLPFYKLTVEDAGPYNVNPQNASLVQREVARRMP